MAIIYFRIKWSTSIEHLEIDLSTLKTGDQISTSEVWPGIEGFTDFISTATYDRLDDGGHRIELLYKSEDHRYLSRTDDICWGTSTLEINSALSVAKVYWQTADSDKSGDGECRIECIDSDRTFEYVSALRVKRRQKEFRDLLLRSYSACAISGEQMTCSLEAAHIVAVGNGGLEVLGNGILLRADLHRLYDSNYFIINLDGTTEATQPVSDYYRKLLSEARLDPLVLRRILHSLRRVLPQP